MRAMLDPMQAAYLPVWHALKPPHGISPCIRCNSLLQFPTQTVSSSPYSLQMSQLNTSQSHYYISPFENMGIRFQDDCVHTTCGGDVLSSSIPTRTRAHVGSKVQQDTCLICIAFHAAASSVLSKCFIILRGMLDLVQPADLTCKAEAAS